MGIAKHAGNHPERFAGKTPGPMQHRIDVPFDVLKMYLFRFHDNELWDLETRTESIGVYVRCTKRLHEQLHALEHGWKAFADALKAHEQGHMMYGDRNKWNYACDIMVNSLLRDEPTESIYKKLVDDELPEGFEKFAVPKSQKVKELLDREEVSYKEIK